MDVPTHDELLDRIAAFCERHGLAESTFGRMALGNPAFVSGLRRNPPVSPTLATLGRVSAFMTEKDAVAEMERRQEAARAA